MQIVKETEPQKKSRLPVLLGPLSAIQPYSQRMALTSCCYTLSHVVNYFIKKTHFHSKFVQ